MIMDGDQKTFMKEVVEESRTLPVLVESGEKGHSDNFAPVSVPGAPRGATGHLRVTGRDGDHLTAVWA